ARAWPAILRRRDEGAIHFTAGAGGLPLGAGQVAGLSACRGEGRAEGGVGQVWETDRETDPGKRTLCAASRCRRCPWAAFVSAPLTHPPGRDERRRGMNLYFVELRVRDWAA